MGSIVVDSNNIDSLCKYQTYKTENNSEAYRLIFIDKVVVTTTTNSTKQIVKELMLANQHRHKRKDNYTRYVTNGHFSKIVEANGLSIMMKDEYGLFFTSGTTRRKGRFDTSNFTNFVVRYGARSYDLTSDGTEQLDELYLYGLELSGRFDANSTSAFYVMRHLELYGPIFSSSSNYNFEFIGYDGEVGSIRFETIERHYPDKTPLIAVGVLRFDKLSKHILDINISKMYLVNQTVINPTREFDFEYSAYLKVNYDPAGVFYFKSCDLTLKWSDSDIAGARYILNPARPYPHLNRLIEREYWQSEEMQTVDGIFNKDKSAWQILALSSRGGSWVYDSNFFKDKPFPIKSTDNFEKLSSFAPLDSMFVETSLIPQKYSTLSTSNFNQAIKAKEYIFNVYNK